MIKKKPFLIARKATLVSLIFTALLISPFQESHAQSKFDSKRKVKKRGKAAEKQKKEDLEAELNISADLRQQHISNQNKDVRKRMKKNKKRAKRYNDHKKSFFLKRWFSSLKIKIKNIF